jgi:hypothetical protein
MPNFKDLDGASFFEKIYTADTKPVYSVFSKGGFAVWIGSSARQADGLEWRSTIY